MNVAVYLSALVILTSVKYPVIGNARLALAVPINTLPVLFVQLVVAVFPSTPFLKTLTVVPL